MSNGEGNDEDDEVDINLGGSNGYENTAVQPSEQPKGPGIKEDG